MSPINGPVQGAATTPSPPEEDGAREALADEVSELERLGHQFQVLASGLLRSGRPGWEAWFEAGLELKRAAQRLRVLAPYAPALRAVALPKKTATKDAAALRPILRPYTRKL